MNPWELGLREIPWNQVCIEVTGVLQGRLSSIAAATPWALKFISNVNIEDPRIQTFLHPYKLQELSSSARGAESLLYIYKCNFQPTMFRWNAIYIFQLSNCKCARIALHHKCKTLTHSSVPGLFEAHWFDWLYPPSRNKSLRVQYCRNSHCSYTQNIFLNRY